VFAFIGLPSEMMPTVGWAAGETIPRAPNRPGWQGNARDGQAVNIKELAFIFTPLMVVA